jgi:hypothetical protein
MEQDITESLPTNKRNDFVASVTDMELLLAERQGAMNNYPGWDTIILEFYETYWNVIKDDMFVLYKSDFYEVKIKAVRKTNLVRYLSKEESPMEPVD